MSLQDRLAKSSIGLKRKMFDFAVKQNGVETPVIRVQVQRDMYGQGRTAVIDNGTQTVFLDIPNELPMSRLRKNVTSAVAETQSVFFYDILPIEGYAKFEDNVEKDDYLIHIVKMDNNTNWFLVLQVTEILGNIVNRHLTWKRFQCAPYSGAMPEEVQIIVDGYVE